jgi:hypothetical protein
MNDPASAALERALELSRAVLAAADRGEGETVISIDAERLQLLKSARKCAGAFDSSQQMLITEIAVLNAKSIGALEHQRRLKGREIELAAVGRRAVKAYSSARYLR